MENAVEALKMAFAVMVFVMALSVSMISFNKVKATSVLILYTKDETNYLEYQGATGKVAENRIVGLETIIPTLYKYYKENYTVLFRKGDYNAETGEFSNVEYLRVYTTPSLYVTETTKHLPPDRKNYLWGKRDKEKNQSTYDTMMQKKYQPYFQGGYTKVGNQDIFSFDLEEETARHEPWTGNYQKAMENLNRFLSGESYRNPNKKDDEHNVYIDYGKANQLGTGGFIGKYANKKFVETIGEYEYASRQSDNTDDKESGSALGLTKPKKKRIFIFTLINGQNGI